MVHVVDLSRCRSWLISLMNGIESLNMPEGKAVVEQGHELEKICRPVGTFDDEERLEGWCAVVAQLFQVALTRDVDMDLLGDLNVILGRLWEALGEYQCSAPIFIQESARGNVAAMFCLAHAYEKGIGLDINMDKAISYFNKAASQGSGAAEYRIGRALERGDWGEQDIDKAMEYYIASMQHGCALAQTMLFDEENEEFVQRCDKSALILYYWRALHGDANVQISLGDCYAFGMGINQNIQMSMEWYRRAAEQGSSIGLRRLGEVYSEEELDVYDPETSFRYFSMAAEQGDVESMYRLGLCYEQGLGTESSLEDARKWLNQASLQGHSEASNKLTTMQE